MYDVMMLPYTAPHGIMGQNLTPIAAFTAAFVFCSMLHTCPHYQCHPFSSCRCQLVGDCLHPDLPPGYVCLSSFLHLPFLPLQLFRISTTFVQHSHRLFPALLRAAFIRSCSYTCTAMCTSLSLHCIRVVFAHALSAHAQCLVPRASWAQSCIAASGSGGSITFGNCIYLLLSIMASDGRWELWRTSLCRHGPCHTMRGCAYAHSLSELRPPDESR